MFKNTASSGKICILNAYDFKYIDISKGNNTNFLKPESGPEKGPINLQIVKNCAKNAPDPSKSCMGSKKWHMCQEHLQTRETIPQET